MLSYLSDRFIEIQFKNIQLVVFAKSVLIKRNETSHTVEISLQYTTDKITAKEMKVNCLET